MKQLVTALLFIMPGVADVMAAEPYTCDTRMFPLSTPASDFRDNGDATVTHLPSKLQWMRCSIGQHWQAGRCEGAAHRLSWAQASDQADKVNREGRFFFNDWRLPNIREIALIAERQCQNPRVNVQVFPQTPAAGYWTSVLKSVGGYEPHVFVMDFGSGGIGYDDQQSLHYARLVRAADH